MPQFVITRGGKLYKEWVFPHADIMTIGRAPINTLVLPDRSQKVSRYHAAIVRAPGPEERYFIRDLGSLHGTKVGGETVYQRLLHKQDVIDIADYTLLYTARVTVERRGKTTAIAFGQKATYGSSADTDRRTEPHTDQRLLQALTLTPDRQDVVEELLRRARVVPTLTALLDGLMEPILHVLRARKGCVGLLETGQTDVFEIVSVRGFAPEQGEQIETTAGEEVCFELLRQGEPVHEDTTLLVPLLHQGDMLGFVCVDREPAASPFLLEDVEFLALLARLAMTQPRGNTPGEKKVQRTRATDEVLAWPMTLVGHSKQMQEVYRQINDAASTDVNVLILGETGTGKGVVARAIHERSARRKGPFVNVDLPNVPQTLAESELLGHKRGAFSDAKEDRAGHFERAHRGTIFLDEIGVLRRELQEKLLKPIAEKEITPLGSQRSMTVDVKVIAATNTDLGQAVAHGTFRADLYRRLNEYTFELPPLRERPEDIPLLACYFLDTYARQYNKRTRGFSHTAMQQLMRYPWPGNVGELESSIKAAVSTDKEVLFSWDVPATTRQTLPARERGKPKSVEEVEKAHIMEVLEFTRGNKTKAATILGYRTTQTLYNKLDTYGIPRNYGSPR